MDFIMIHDHTTVN